MTVPPNKFAQIDEAAHSGAFGFNPFVLPTDKQMKAGNYKKGKFSLHGLKIAIEQPRDSYRTGTDKSGNRWSCRLAANYGYILKTTGNDGDHVDCFIGSYPESETVYVVNQYVNGVFDEHKVMLCYPAESFARSDYQFSYSRDWNGLHSIVSMSIKQFKQWLKHGDMTMPVTAADNLPITEVSQMQRTQWDDNGNPIGKSIGKLMYELRGLDDDGLLLDSISDDDFYHEWGDSLTGSEEGIFDSLNVPYARMRMTTNLIKREFNKVAGTLKVAEPAEGETPNPYISEKPFTKDGMSMVMVKYRLTDEQTITIMFFNPDLTPSKVTKTDIMVAFKWMLNKKDLTVLVSPEFGQDVKLNVVAARIMGLANKNMDAFARANKSNADNIKAIADLNAEISTLEAELEQAKAANLVAQSNADNAEIEAVTNPANVSSSFIPTHTYYDPDDGTVELMRNSDGNWQSADGTEYLDIDDEVVAIGGVAVVPQPDKPMTDLFKSGLLKALKQKTANTDGSTPSIDDFSLRVGKLILEKNISPEMLAELSGASADKAIDAIYPMIWSNTQPTQTIDPVTIANINASGVSAAIKKKAIAYLSANPTTHSFEGSGLSNVSQNAIMESVNNALYSEVKSILPDTEVGAFSTSTEKTEGRWTAKLIKKSVSKDGAIDVVLIGVENYKGNYKFFAKAQERIGTSITKDDNLFDSTQTLEDLRSWGFALPFDLDVKAFVANVIKPVVDKFLSKQAAVVPSKASKPSTPNLNQSDREIKKAAIIDWHRDTDLMLLVGDYFGIDSELDEAYVYARLTKSKNITPEELSEAYELVAFVESDEDVPYEFYSKFEDTDPESVDIGSYKEGEIPFSMLTKKTRTAWIIEKIIKQHDGVVSWGDFNGSVSGSIFDSVLNGVVGQFGTKTGGLVGYIEINDNGEAVISINSKGIAMRPPTNNLTDKIQNLKKQIDGAFGMFTETKIVEGNFPIWKPKPTVTVTPAVTPKPQTPEVEPPTNSFDADIEALRELVGSEEFKPLVNSLLDALEDAGNESYDDVIGEIINQHAAAKVAAAKRV